MVKVSIIESNKFQENKMRKYIEQVIQDSDLDMEVEYSTSNVKEFMYEIEWDESRRVYFIDVDLGGYINGIDLAVFIRKYDNYGFIVFINQFGDFNQLMIEYNINALKVIPKNNEVEIKSIVKECLININAINQSEKQDKENLYTLRTIRGDLLIKKDEIMFIEGTKVENKIIIHQNNRQIEMRGNLKELIETIGKDFKLLTKTLLLNTKKVVEVNKEGSYIKMSNGENIGFDPNILGALKEFNL
jgi:two-component system response regulator AgrA